MEPGKFVVADCVDQGFLVGVAVLGLGFGAGEFEDFAVLDSGGAGGFTGAASEAGVERLVGGFVPSLILVSFPGEGDSAPGRLGFITGDEESGAGFEAEATADALGGEVAELRH